MNAERTETASDEIRKKMRRVRNEIVEDASELADARSELTDWQAYVRRFPLASAAGAAFVGYMLAPARQCPSPHNHTESNATPSSATSKETQESSSFLAGLASAAASLVVSAAVRGAVSQLGGVLSDHFADSPEAP